MRRLHWFIARHYLGASRGRGLLSLITWIALGGIMVGVTALVVVTAVMSGMQRDLTAKILESTPHIYVLQQGTALRMNEWEHVRDSIMSVDGVVGAAPFVLTQVVIRNQVGYSESANLYGISVDTTGSTATDMERQILQGVLDLDPPESGVTPILMGSGLAGRMLLFEGAFLGAMLLGSVLLVVRSMQRDMENARKQQNFLSAVTHELKSPIASARLYLESLQLGRAEGEKRDRYLTHAREDLNRLSDMVEDLLQTARLSTTGPDLAPDRVELGEVVAAVLSSLEQEHAAAGAQVHFEHTPVHVRAAKALNEYGESLIADDRHDEIDPATAYFATMALFQMGGTRRWEKKADDPWRRWNPSLKLLVIDRDDPVHGWAPRNDPITGRPNDRVTATALFELSLQVYYRYGRVFGIYK